ncbi:RNA methylase [Mycena indigotica]|uniref:tRNA (guanine(10)-N(2))-methyltransferase n=1 Tax=Mycena indigotica TaxID=2126181 RepID=A0A8H6WF22_9AGAR|nr:RNA methylase [Mycena indigotica]KAF7315392.1 RNA methylase [Mycena indigotica]
MPSYLFIFAQTHAEFRLPELESIAELHGFAIHNMSRDTSSPFAVYGLDSDEHARILAKRCILLKHVYEFYAQGATYEELHSANEKSRHLWSHYAQDASFKFVVSAHNHTIPSSRHRTIMESFNYMDFRGEITLKNPQVTLGIFEDYEKSSHVSATPSIRDSSFRQVYFGRLVSDNIFLVGGGITGPQIADGEARSLIGVFDVKKRLYYGNTSMESEVSLLMANQALATSSKLIYDPFCGTGSMAYPVAYFGAQVYGSDIDGRQIRGKGGKDSPPGVLKAAQQYGVADRIIDLCTFDVTVNPWRCGNLFDAIVTDPPYGVRAGAKRLGRKKELSEEKKAANIEHQRSARNRLEPYIPPTKPYELSALVVDLVLLARYLLKPKGRLVFFLPTVNESYEEVDVHSMLCEGMTLVANSLQDFGSWGRRLVTIRKDTEQDFAAPTFTEHAPPNHVPAHKDFRDQYFRGFKNPEAAQE